MRAKTEKSMKVTVHLFSHARYIFGKDKVCIDLPPGAKISDLIAALKAAGGDHFKNIPFRIALNHKFVSEAAVINAGDELACIPPVQGGYQ